MKISVITATFNSAATVGSCMASVASQDWGDIEHVIVDGGSTDDTLDVVNNAERAPDQLVSEPDKGIYDALNKGIAMATGDVVGFLHSDDVFADEAVLSRIADAFERESVDAVYGDLQYVRAADLDAVIRHWTAGEFSRKKLQWGWMPPHPTLYVRREWYEQIGGFDLNYSIAADYHSMLKLFGNPEFRAAYISSVLVKMRVGGASNRSLTNIVRKSREDLRAMRETGVGALGGYGALAWKNVSKVGQFLKRK